MNLPKVDPIAFERAREKARRLTIDLKQGRVNSDNLVIDDIAEGLAKGPPDEPQGEFGDLIKVLIQMSRPRDAHKIAYAMLTRLAGTHIVKTPGYPNPNRSSSLKWYAQCFEEEDTESGAEQVYLDWIHINECVFGRTAVEAGAAYLRVANYYAEQKLFERAKLVGGRAIEILREVPSDQADRATASEAIVLGEAYQRAQLTDAAEQMFKFQVQICHQLWRPNESANTALCSAEIYPSLKLAGLYANTDRLPEAMAIYRSILDWILANLATSKLHYEKDITDIVSRYEKLNKVVELRSFLQSASAQVRDTKTGFERVIAIEHARLNDPENSFKYYRLRIDIEKATMSENNTAAYVVAAYKDYANALKQNSYAEKAESLLEEAKLIEAQFAKDCVKRFEQTNQRKTVTPRKMPSPSVSPSVQVPAPQLPPYVPPPGIPSPPLSPDPPKKRPGIPLQDPSLQPIPPLPPPSPPRVPLPPKPTIQSTTPTFPPEQPAISPTPATEQSTSPSPQRPPNPLLAVEPPSRVTRDNINPSIDDLQMVDQLEAEVRKIEGQSAPNANIELCETRTKYCLALEKVGDYLSARDQWMKVVHEDKLVYGDIDNRFALALTNLMSCCKKAGDESYYKYAKEVASLWSQKTTSADHATEFPLPLLQSLLEDSHYREAYLFAMACINTLRRRDCPEHWNLFGSPTRSLHETAMKLYTNGYFELAIELYRQWIQKVEKLTGPSSLESEFLHLHKANFLAHCSCPDEAVRTLIIAADMIKEHPVDSSAHAYHLVLYTLEELGFTEQATHGRELLIPKIESFDAQVADYMQAEVSQYLSDRKNFDAATDQLKKIEERILKHMPLRQEMLNGQDFGQYLSHAIDLVTQDHNYVHCGPYLSSFAVSADRTHVERIFLLWFLAHLDYETANIFAEDIIHREEVAANTQTADFIEVLLQHARCLEEMERNEEAFAQRRRAAQIEIPTKLIEPKIGRGKLPSMTDIVLEQRNLLAARIERLWKKENTLTAGPSFVFQLHDPGRITKMKVQRRSGWPGADEIASRCIRESVKYVTIGPLKFMDFKCNFKSDCIELDSTVLKGKTDVTIPGDSGDLNEYFWKIHDEMERLIRSPGLDASELRDEGACMIVQFEVNKKGNILHPVVLRGVSDALDQKALAALKAINSFDELPPRSPPTLLIQCFLTNQPKFPKTGFVGLPPRATRRGVGMGGGFSR